MSSQANRAAIGTPISDAGSGPLSVVIEYQGKSHRYDETAGTDLGDYVDPLHRFVQGCVRTTQKDHPLSVLFRRDRTSDRAEIVFELGRLWGQTPPADLDAYRVTIIRGDKTVLVADVPRHFWFARWRWQTAPRPVTVKVVGLIANGMLPRYDNRVNAGTARPTQSRSYQVMGLAGVNHYMPTTGERNDIGPVTEPQAEFICTGRDTALASVLAQAEAAGTIPWHFRDEKTGAPLDTIRYANATLYGPNIGDPFIARAKSDITIDSAHQPALAYLPFLLTGDPYHLETLQFQVTFNILEGPPNSRYRIGQVRAHAWSIRTLAQAAKATPDQTPQWLLPRSYFRELLNRQRDWLTHTFVESPEVIRTVFRTTAQTMGDRNEGTMEAGTYIAPWEDEFQAVIFGWVVQMGFTDWQPIFRWKIGSTIARTDGLSGWVRARPVLYRQILREHSDLPWARSWAESWTINAARQNLT